jgi:PEGA domain
MAEVKKTMRKTLLTLAVALMTIAPMSASAAVRVVVGGRGYYGAGFYGGGFYAPYWGSYWGPGYGYGYYPNSAEVKLDTKVKDAQVFINGAYAGTTHENRSMHLRPGTYKIEIRENGQTPFAQSVYAIAGKTIHLHPEL